MRVKAKREGRDSLVVSSQLPQQTLVLWYVRNTITGLPRVGAMEGDDVFWMDNDGCNVGDGVGSLASTMDNTNQLKITTPKKRARTISLS